MKNCITFTLFIFILSGCTKEKNDKNNSFLMKVTFNGLVNESFEYNNDEQLVKHNTYSLCSIPVYEFSYVYYNKKIAAVNSTIRSLYSSTQAQCDPLSGLHYAALFEHDNLGRINVIKRENSLATFFYNSNSQVDRQIIKGGNNNNIYTYKYDASGNLIEETDGQGNITQYQFDNKVNPYFLIKCHPDIVSAFYVSPNNVAKIKRGASTWVEIKYAYNELNLPLKMLDANGQTYEFVYKQ